jgi:hypothetical protein
MDGTSVDRIARVIAAKGSRRALAGAFAVAVFGLAGRHGAEASICRELGVSCRENADCCSGECGEKDRRGRRACSCPKEAPLCGGVCCGGPHALCEDGVCGLERCSEEGCGCQTGTFMPCDEGLYCQQLTDRLGGPGICQIEEE